MTNRRALADAFLSKTEWAGAPRRPLAGDASNRRYERLNHPQTGATAVLMDAPSAHGNAIAPFVKIANFLLELGLSAPQILAQDAANGFLLLEDLGDALYSRVLADTPSEQTTLYAAATDVLSHLHKATPPADLTRFSPAEMTQVACLPWDWYLTGIDAQNRAFQPQFVEIFQPLLEQFAADDSILLQRDYHADNLLWLPERQGIARVGLLDFQDAMRGHRAYDLVSLLQDARRDVSAQIEAQMVARYIGLNHLNAAEFERAYALLGVQRNLRIVGVFARLCLRDGKPQYLHFMPRVWALLLRDLDHPALTALKEFVLSTLPEPTPERVQRLSDQCPAL